MHSAKKAILGVCLILIISFGVWWFLANFKSAPQKPKNDYQVAIEEDHSALDHLSSTKKSKPSAVYRAMIELSEVKDPTAREVALALSEDGSAYLREGAAQALGHYDDEKSWQALKKLLEDKAPSVRQFAIQGISESSSPEHRAMLSGLDQHAPETPEEKIEMIASHYILEENPSRKSEILSALAKLALDSTETGSEATSKMVTIAPTAPETVAVAKQKVEAGKDAQTMGIAIRLLSSQKNPWIMSRLDELSKKQDPMILKAVIQSLHRTCIESRWNILEHIVATQTDPAVIDLALEEPIYMPDPKAEDFYRKASANPHLNSQEVAAIASYTERLRNTPMSHNPCIKPKD